MGLSIISFKLVHWRALVGIRSKFTPPVYTPRIAPTAPAVTSCVGHCACVRAYLVKPPNNRQETFTLLNRRSARKLHVRTSLCAALRTNRVETKLNDLLCCSLPNRYPLAQTCVHGACISIHLESCSLYFILHLEYRGLLLADMKIAPPPLPLFASPLPHRHTHWICVMLKPVLQQAPSDAEKIGAFQHILDPGF